jgi:hypothetical protein
LLISYLLISRLLISRKKSKKVLHSAARGPFSFPMNLNTVLPSNATLTLADLTPAEEAELCAYLDARAKEFFDAEEEWDRTFQYGIDVGLDVGPTV